MKYLCLISHRVPGLGPGKFKDFDAGQEYETQEVGEPEPGYWRAVDGVTGAGRPLNREGAKSARTAKA
jgi:hypothetical protein